MKANLSLKSAAAGRHQHGAGAANQVGPASRTMHLSVHAPKFLPLINLRTLPVAKDLNIVAAANCTASDRHPQWLCIGPCATSSCSTCSWGFQ